jgi:RNA 2',3'-cyclic 3'-phosphodiesterase
MARLFFALQPDPAARAALSALASDIARACGGRPVPPAKIHLTLLFLGDVEAAGIDRVCTVARGLVADAFGLVVDRVGSFARQSVAWVAPAIIPPELMNLQDALSSRLREAGFALEERRFEPHITMARRIAQPVSAAQTSAIKWEAGEFVLVESDLASGGYRDLARWPIGRPGEMQRLVTTAAKGIR